MSTQESEKQQPNPCYPAFDLLLAKLLAAEQALSVSEAVFHHALELDNKWLAQIPEGEMLGMMADICDDRISGCIKYILSFRAPGQEKHHLMKAICDFRTQAYLWDIARAFEHFREFVEGIMRCLPHQKAARPSHLLARVALIVQGRRKRVNRRFNAALKQIRKASSSLGECETQNTRRLHLAQWISMAEAIRNAVAHNEGILRKADYERYSSSGLETHFPGELEEDTGYILKPTADIVEKTIRTFREYGLAIYKAVSDAHGYPATLLGRNGEVTTWRR